VPFESFFYFLGEAFKSLYRNRWLSIASVGVVAITLLMLGTFMAVNFNINHMAETVKNQVEITVQIDDSAGVEERNQLRQMLVAHNSITEVRFVSREEALNRLKEQLPPGSLDGYENPEDNPLPDSFEIRTSVPEEVIPVAKEIEGYPAVEKVLYGEGTVENLFKTTTALKIIGIVLMALLAVTAVFLISHTIRLTVLLRRREIMIMKYVGATNSFIRWPFLLEGLFLGLAGAVLPLLVLYYSYGAALQWVDAANLTFLSLIPLSTIMLQLFKYLVPLGTGLGVLGSIFSMGRFLKV